MRKHPVMLTDQGVSKHRYLELQAICQQYRDYLKGYGGEWGAWRAKTIKATAKAVGGTDWRTILQSVTEAIPKDELPAQPGSATREWYTRRLCFYIMLHYRLIDYEKTRGRGAYVDDTTTEGDT